MLRFLLPTAVAATLAATHCFHAAAALEPNAAPSASAQVDALLAADWQKEKLSPNAPISDEVFVRRIYLDVIGRIPTRDETERFLKATGANKRSELIDHLLASEGYVQHFFSYWADILRAQSSGFGSPIGSAAYLDFIKDSLRANKPYDQFVRELLTAQGKAWENGAVGYYMRDRGMPLDNMANTARVFLGTRLECAQCHNHPFDKWKQLQFYHMAAFTFGMETNYPGIREMEPAIRLMVKSRNAREARLKSGNETERQQAQAEEKEARWVGKVLDDLGDRVRYTKIQFLPRKELRLPHDYQYGDAAPKSVVMAATVLGKAVEVSPDSDLLSVYAQWLTSPENPRFTTVIANRMWKKVFGLGLIEPVDDINERSTAVNPELMKFLEKLMVDVRYDLKAFVRVLYQTRAYQSSVSREEIPVGTPYHFTGPVLRRMSAEQIWDSMITLIQPPLDTPRRFCDAPEIAAEIALRRKVTDALDLLTAQELFEGAVRASKSYESVSARADQLKVEYAAAQEAQDKNRMATLAAEIGELNLKARSSANDLLVIPAMARLYTKVTGAPAPEPPPSAMPASEQTMEPKMKNGKRREQPHYIAIPGYDDSTPTQEPGDSAAATAALRDEARRRGLPEGEWDRFAAVRQKQRREWLRAADLESPAPRGHFLREFGQSDREVIENANPSASVPQALALMNGQLFPQITDRYSELMLAINQATSPDEKIDAVYVTLLSRKPTPREKQVWSGAHGNALTGIEDLIFALINTQQFIFIQ